MDVVVELMSLSNEDIQSRIDQWLKNTVIPTGQTLGPWIVTDAWHGWDYAPAEIVAEVVGLTVGASSDMYDFDPGQLRLFSVTQSLDGDGYELDWTDTEIMPLGSDQDVSVEWTGVVDVFAEEDHDATTAVTLRPIGIKPDVLGDLFADTSIIVEPELVTRRIEALAQQAAIVVAHLRDEVGRLPITIAS